MKPISAKPFERLSIGALGLAAIGMAGFSTFARYLKPAAAPDWSEEVVVLLSVWALWLTAASLARTGGHIQAEFVVEQLGHRAKLVLEIFHALAGLIFSCAMSYAGVRIVLLAIATGERSESTLGLPLALYYAAMPVGMAAMLIAYLIRMVSAVREFSTGNPRHP